MENFKEPVGENTECTDLAVGSQLCGPKCIKVIALLKWLTWFIIFTKKTLKKHICCVGSWSGVGEVLPVLERESKCVDTGILSDIWPAVEAVGEQSDLDRSELLPITWVF